MRKKLCSYNAKHMLSGIYFIIAWFLIAWFLAESREFGNLWSVRCMLVFNNQTLGSCSGQ